jgi:hypothetical protein
MLHFLFRMPSCIPGSSAKDLWQGKIFYWLLAAYFGINFNSFAIFGGMQSRNPSKGGYANIGLSGTRVHVHIYTYTRTWRTHTWKMRTWNTHTWNVHTWKTRTWKTCTWKTLKLGGFIVTLKLGGFIGSPPADLVIVSMMVRSWPPWRTTSQWTT